MKKGITKKQLLSGLAKCLFAICILLNVTKDANAQTYQPWHYFTFEGSNPLKDSLSSTVLNTVYYQSAYNIGNGAVGKTLALGTGSSDIMMSNTLYLDSVITIEFLFKPTNFESASYFSRNDGSFLINMGYPFIQFITNATSASGSNIHNDMNIDLTNIGRGSYSFYVDGNYHQFVFKYNPRKGTKEIWIDGQLPAGFSTTTATGHFNPNTSNVNNNTIHLSSVTSYQAIKGNLDEIAIYNLDLPGSMIYKHFTEFQQGKHFTFNSTTLTPPTPAPISAGIDINDFAPGHPSPTINAVDQLKNVPTPRFKKGHTLLPNFNWIGLEYFGSAYQPGVSTSQSVANTVEIQKELARNFNYSILVASNTNTYDQYTNPTYYQGAWVQLANQNPQWKTGAISFWPQISPRVAGFASSDGYISNKNLPAQHYLRNGSGSFVDLNGNSSSSKYWSPAAPVDSLYKDGQTQKFLIQKLLNSLTRPLNLICENAEVYPKAEPNAMQNDPTVVSDKNSTSFDWDTYAGNRKMRASLAYRDQFINISGLQNTNYTEYQISGAGSRLKYSETRNINKPINGQIYATPDFYPRWAGNWYTGVSAWNGWKHIIDGRFNELKAGDRLYSPFVAAGWDLNEEANIRPGQWLGLLKLLGMTGAEFYYTGYFNEQGSYNAPNPPPANPANYAWQAVMPSYAQATTSRFEDILRNGSLLPGDMLFNTANPNQPGYSFTTGDIRKMVVIRKHDQKNLYAITGTIQPNSNMMGNAEVEGDAAITLNGQSLQFKIRRQGSTYIYDNTNPSQPVFYQLDAWHESTHPSRWSKDFNFEAEVFDNASATAIIKTDREKNAAAGDFRNSTSYVTTVNGSTAYPVLEYNFTPRTTTTYSFWIRMRSHTGASGGVSINISGQTQKSIGCITDTTWNWYSIDACSGQAIRFNNLTNQEYTLQITPNSPSIEIDRILLSTDASLNLNANQLACGTSVATVTASGPTSFCQGGSVILTAGAGTSYTWSNGQTTQSITVSAAGNYSVAVNNGTGCAAVSSPVAVSITNSFTPMVTANGLTTFCPGQSVLLTASIGTSYLWSNGATTQSISASASGNYLVTVSNSNGCIGTSAVQNVSVLSSPNAAITPSGNTKFCQGNSIQLSALSGLNYAWSNGSTTQQITVNASGSYSVVVSNSSGCTSTSQTLSVVVVPLPVATITATGSLSFCNGGTVKLIASGGSTYAWSNGATTFSINASQSGSYYVTATDINGCSGLSSPINVTAFPAATASVTVNGPSSLATGQTTVLTANSGSSYVWQPGGLITQSITVITPGNYSVTVVDANGCSATSAPVTITQGSSNIGIHTTGSLSFCEGGSVQLSASGGTYYLWSPGGQTTSTITAVSSGTYFVTMRNSQYQVIGFDSAKVTVNAKPMLPGISITYIPNTAFQLTASEPSAAFYEWSNGATTATVNVTQPQTLTVKVTNGFGCKSGLQSMVVNSVMTNPCSKPDLLTSYNISDTSAILGWNPAITGEQFVLRYWEKGSSTVIIRTLRGTSSTYAATDLHPGIDYNWNIEMVCGANRFMSATNTFKTLSTPLSCGSIPQHLRAININVRRADLKWYSTTADVYKLRFRNVASTIWTTKQYNGIQNNSGVTLIGLNSNTTYEWQVGTTCNGYTTAWSNSSMFTTLDTCGYLGTLTVSNTYPTSVDLQWTNTNPMSNIRVKITDTSTGMIRIINSNSNPANGLFTARYLKLGTTYTASVRGICNGIVFGPWSNEVTFTTNNLTARIESGNPLQLTGFPNPASDRLTYSFVSDDTKDYVLKVCDMSGRELKQETRTADNGDNVGEIPVTSYSKGIYLLIVQKGTETSRFRFSVE